MRSPEEKLAFATRLNLALLRAERPVSGPSDLALHFNLRHTGETITPQAAQQWLAGKTIPAPDKIATLANWLGVSLHWLRFGHPDQKGAPSAPAAPTELDRRLLEEFRRLSPAQKQLVIDLIEQIAIGQRNPAQ